MKEHDKIKELFSEKLGNYSAPVKPELWNAIAAKVAAGSTVATTGTSLLVKSIIGISAASIIGVSAYFVFQEDGLPTEQAVEMNPTFAENEVEKTQEPALSKDIAPAEEKTVINEPVDEFEPVVSEEVVIDESKNNTTPIDTKEPVSTYVPKERKTPMVVIPVETKINESKEKPQVVKNSKETETTSGLDSETQNTKPVVYLAEITLLPNSFTPNGDRVNDEFFIEFKGDLIDFNIVILDLQNRSVFESKDPNFKWNGMNKSGEISPSGRYYYIVTARDSNGNPINHYNTLSIER